MNRWQKQAGFVLVLLVSMAMILMLAEVETVIPQDISTKHFPLTSGSAVQPGELDAVGMLNGGACTASLIGPNRVLTAAHCVCPNDWATKGCSNRANFTLEQVFPRDDPNTSTDESLTRRDITIGGTVTVHPEFEDRGWLREDFAVVRLDRPVTDFVLNVTPLRLEAPYNTVLGGDALTLVGYGRTGQDCSQPPTGKMKLTLAATGANQAAIWFAYTGTGACFGDSGGPVLNSAQQIVGVASWIGQDGSGTVESSTYRPTSYGYDWITGEPDTAWSAVFWEPVERANINSHGANTWCPNGSFLVGFDLDGDRNLSPHDAPIVGQAQCASLAGVQNWGSCTWVKVEQGGLNSHAARPAWCPNGSFLVGLDLDGPRELSDRDSPVIGQAQCCTPGGKTRWGSTYWSVVGAAASHNPGQPWCFDGAFLTQIDLDQYDENYQPDGYDAPIVGQAKCSMPR